MKRLIVLIALFLAFAPTVATARNDEPTPPPSFSSSLASFISYSDDVTALRSWFETLTAAEQQAHGAEFQAATDKLLAMEEGLVAAVISQIESACCDSNLYLVFDVVKSMDPIKARKIFTGTVGQISKRLNHDYVTSPSNPDFARRARDMQAIRAYIGHQG